MHDWHRTLADALTAETSAGASPDGATQLEIAFGRARTAIVYALELSHAHRVPATGSVAGDDIWMRLGDARARFTLNRREGFILVSRPDASEVRVRWDGAARTLVAESALGGASGASPQIGASGEAIASADLEAVARSAIDALVVGWKALASSAKERTTAPLEFDNEPTKG
jgi:hypothetical protein